MSQNFTSQVHSIRKTNIWVIQLKCVRTLSHAVHLIKHARTLSKLDKHPPYVPLPLCVLHYVFVAIIDHNLPHHFTHHHYHHFQHHIAMTTSPPCYVFSVCCAFESDNFRDFLELSVHMVSFLIISQIPILLSAVFFLSFAFRLTMNMMPFPISHDNQKSVFKLMLCI